MKIGLDIMGGDFAPHATVLGAIAAHKTLPDHQKLVLIGDERCRRLTLLAENGNYSPDNFEFVHTTDVIGMGEHPTKAIVHKTESSIAIGFKLLKGRRYRCFLLCRKQRRYAGWGSVKRKNHSGCFKACHHRNYTSIERHFKHFG